MSPVSIILIGAIGFAVTCGVQGQGDMPKYGAWTGERAIAAKDWAENSPAIIARIEKLLSERKFTAAESEARRYNIVATAQIAPLLKRARVGMWQAELAKVGPKDYARRVRMYTELVSLESDNSTYKRELESAKNGLRAQRAKYLAGLSRSRDEVEKITFYSSPDVSMRSVGNYWALYIGVPDRGIAYLRFKWMYAASDWLFIKHLTLSVDGVKVDAPIGYFAVKRYNSGDRIWEWGDESVDDASVSFFEKLTIAKKVIIRYEGDKYHADRVLSDKEKKAFSRVLGAYEIAKSKNQ